MNREEAIDIIKCLAWHTRPNEEDIEQAIKALEQEPKTGHWIADVFVDECSVCGEQTLFFEDQQKNFCPNCGARMESEE